MSLIEGFSPCLELGVNGCVVWWEAWAAIAAIVALVVAFFTMLLTGLSAAAVFLLGQKTNRLAALAHDLQRKNTSAKDEELRKEQLREEAVALAYTGTELADLAIALSGIVALLGPGMSIELQNFIDRKNSRHFLAGMTQKLETNRLERLLPRLHALPTDNGLKLASLLGMCHSLVSRCKAHAELKSPAEIDEGVERDERRIHLEICHGNRLTEATAALAIARELSAKSYAMIFNPNRA